MLLTFSDDSVAQITASDIVLGCIQNLLTVYSSKGVIQCNINLNTDRMTYTSDERVMSDAYIPEKVETRAGRQFSNPDEDFCNGFPHEVQAFCEAVTFDRPPSQHYRTSPRYSRGVFRCLCLRGYGAGFDLSEWMTD